jgi:predicted DCC family thiol-disulfide oxidoreductase YuxK
MSQPALAPGKTVEVFYDGDCPLCMREIRMLMRKDRQQRIQFTNLAAPGFIAEDYGRSYAAFMDRIAGRLPDGTWIEGVEVFRRLYSAIGWTRAVALTRLPGISHLLTVAYRVFARNRLRWTGRCAPDGSCAVPPRAAA